MKAKLIAAGFLVFLTLRPSWAEPVCATRLDPVLEAIRSSSPLNLDGATCQQSRELSGATRQTCYWTFAYRAPEAEAAFEDWSNALLACYGSENAQLSDQPVNHPDSYILHRFKAETAEISLSLKDKAGLGQTLIFLQISKTK